MIYIIFIHCSRKKKKINKAEKLLNTLEDKNIYFFIIFTV